MEQDTRTGKTPRIGRIARLFVFGVLVSSCAWAQGPSCQLSSQVPAVASEGLSEQIGDIVLTCTGGTAGATAVGSIFISLGANITNRLDGNGNLAGLSVTSAGAAVTVATPSVFSPTTIVVNALNYVVPTPNTTPVTISFSGLRTAVANVTGGTGTTSMTASVTGTGFTFVGGPSLLVGTPSPSLLSSVVNIGIPCRGSPAPATLDFSTLISTGTLASSLRITETHAIAFVAKKVSADTGVRFLVKLSGYGTGVRVFVPDAIVGNSGSVPTSSGSYVTTISGGSYTPGSNQLLLARVAGADATGAGGSLSFPLPGVATNFTAVTELTVTNGSAYAVYEVLDSNPFLRESAQIPVYLATAPENCSTSAQATMTVTMAPVSNVSIATTTDPIPRYVAVTPLSDCQQVGDCGASYFPNPSVRLTPIELTGVSQGATQNATIAVGNSGSGQVIFTASVGVASVASWLSVSPAQIVNNGSFNLVADPGGLPQGTFTATVVITAGTAGPFNVPVTFTVGAPGVTIRSVVNAANGQPGSVAPGSFATIYGLNLTGRSTLILFNGLPATVVFGNASQINLLVPAALGAATSANVVAVIDGQTSNTFRVALAPNAPAVFNPGILNQNNSVNLATAPASPGDIVQVFLTGLAPAIPASLTVTIGTERNLTPVYSGAVASINGLQQVNVRIPASPAVTGNSTTLSVCVPGTTSTEPLCSVPVPLYIR